MGVNIATAVVAEVGTKQPPADINKSGKWQILVNPLAELSTKLKTEKGNALIKAQASFIYTGGTIGPQNIPLPPIISQVELIPQKHGLAVAGKDILAKGDEVKDAYENKVKVSEVLQKCIIT